MSEFQVSEDEAPLIAEICRRLDGIPLAIELAAGRVNAYGIAGTASLLNTRFCRRGAGGGRPFRGIRRSARRWAGATTCCLRSKVRFCAGCRCSSGRSRWKRRLQSPATKASPSRSGRSDRRSAVKVSHHSCFRRPFAKIPSARYDKGLCAEQARRSRRNRHIRTKARGIFPRPVQAGRSRM